LGWYLVSRWLPFIVLGPLAFAGGLVLAGGRKVLCCVGGSDADDAQQPAIDGDVDAATADAEFDAAAASVVQAADASTTKADDAAPAKAAERSRKAWYMDMATQLINPFDYFTYELAQVTGKLPADGQIVVKNGAGSTAQQAVVMIPATASLDDDPDEWQGMLKNMKDTVVGSEANLEAKLTLEIAKSATETAQSAAQSVVEMESRLKAYIKDTHAAERSDGTVAPLAGSAAASDVAGLQA
jgi:hypothetical protein